MWWHMELLGNGIDYASNKPLRISIDDKKFVDSILNKKTKLKELIRSTSFATSFRYGTEFDLGMDIRDPKSAGWTFLINGNDPQKNEIIEKIRPLAEYRHMENPDLPLIYNGEDHQEWFKWLNENYYFPAIAENKNPAYYILMVGSPELIPFQFQSFVDSAACVGRLDYDSLNDINSYVDKIIRLENSEPIVDRKALVFGTDHGIITDPDTGWQYKDATMLSRKYMAEPIADFISNKIGVGVERLIGDDATKDNLVKSTFLKRPALVYTASHGLSAMTDMYGNPYPLKVQKRYNGAIVCGDNDPEGRNRYFAGSDVPTFESFCEGSVFFQFACLGYGTPFQSDFAYWSLMEEGEGGVPLDEDLNKTTPFVADLPKRMLAHSKGPVAYIGHVDNAWVHGFADPDNPEIEKEWHPRIAPFVNAIRMLLDGQTVGLSLGDMNKRYDLLSCVLASYMDGIKTGRIDPESETIVHQIAETFMTRNDAQNYMVYGDPAARIVL